MDIHFTKEDVKFIEDMMIPDVEKRRLLETKICPEVVSMPVDINDISYYIGNVEDLIEDYIDNEPAEDYTRYL